jgi:hypothetical protein
VYGFFFLYGVGVGDSEAYGFFFLYGVGVGDSEAYGFFFLYGVGVGDSEVYDFFFLYFVVAALSVLDGVVSIVSFLLAHDVIKLAAARTATDVIRDFFIGVVNVLRMFSPGRDCKQLI